MCTYLTLSHIRKLPSSRRPDEMYRYLPWVKWHLPPNLLEAFWIHKSPEYTVAPPTGQTTVLIAPRSWWGWLAGVFIKMPESLRCCYEISITLTNLTFFLSSLLVRTFPLKWIWLCFHCTATCDAPSFLLGHNQPRGVLLENTWVEKLFENIFPFNLIQLIVVKVWKSYKGFDWTF